MALVLLAVLAAVCWAFDWNWFRPVIRHYVRSHSGRDIEFADLRVHWLHGLDPTIELRGLTIQNAPWAASRAPFMHAGRVAATLSWRSIGSGMTVIDLIELEDAQVDMERRTDGVRNWRLGHPDDIGPAHVQVLALDARRSQLHMIHGGLGLDLTAQISPLATPQALPAHADLPLTKWLQFQGTAKGQAFSGATQVSDVLGFGQTPRMFALRGDARFGVLRLNAAGVTNDVHTLGDLDLDATLSTAPGGSPWPLPDALARLRPLSAQGHVSRRGEAWNATGMRLHAGRGSTLVAEIAFNGDWRSDTPRRTVKANLHDAVLDFDDVALLRGKTPPGDKPAPESRPDDRRTLSAAPLPLARLRELDADVELKPARLTGLDRGLVQSLQAHATLTRGVLQVQGLDFGVAGGHLTGAVRVDASRSPAGVALDLDAHGVRAQQLSAALATNGALDGTVAAHAELRSRGDSARALVAAATGKLTVALGDGATVSKRMDAKLGLDGGQWLSTLFDKSARVPVQCASVTLALQDGVATSRRFVFETADTALAGSGSLNLADETLDATVTPARKKFALLSLDKAIHAQGSWHDVKISLQAPREDEPLRCTAGR